MENPSAQGASSSSSASSPAPGPASSPASAYPSPAAGWGAVALLFLLSTLSLLDRNLVALLVTNIKSDLGVTEVETGMLIGAAFALFYALGALPFGWALDRYSRSSVIWFGVTLWSIGTIGCGLARSFWTFFAARAIVGGGEAALIPGTHSLLPDLFPRDKLALPMSIYSSASKVGAGASLAIGGALASLIDPATSYALPVLGALKGWQVIFLLCGVPGLFLAFSVFLIPDPNRDRARRTDTSGYGEYLRFVSRNRRFFLAHHGASVPITLIIVGLLAWTPAFYMRVHGWPVDRVGIWMGVAVSAGPVLGLPIHGWIVDRLFRGGMLDAHLRYMIGSMLVSLPLIIGAFLVASPMLSMILFGIFFFTICGYLSLPATMLQIVLPPTLRGKAASVLLMLNGLIGVGGGPVLVAYLTQSLGGDRMVGYSLLICSAVSLPLCAILYVLSLRPARRLVAARLAEG